MSHFTRVRTALRDAELLVAALGKAGFGTVELHEQPQTLYGYRGDARSQKAEVVVRRRYIGGSSNDIGFARKEDGAFEAIISEYDRRHYNEQWLRQLSQHYGHAAALRYAETNGFEVQADDVEASGARKLVLRRST